MRGTYSFLIKAKTPFVDVLRNADKFYRYLERDVIVTAQISDRHGLEFDTIFEQIKQSYIISIKKILPHIDVKLGFDHYWGFDGYGGRVIALSEILQSANLVKTGTGSAALDYLIQTNIED